MCVCVRLCVRVCVCAPDPAPVLEATQTLEDRLQQLQSGGPASEALVRVTGGPWKNHLECLDRTGELTGRGHSDVVMGNKEGSQDHKLSFALPAERCVTTPQSGKANVNHTLKFSK